MAVHSRELLKGEGNVDYIECISEWIFRNAYHRWLQYVTSDIKYACYEALKSLIHEWRGCSTTLTGNNCSATIAAALEQEDKTYKALCFFL